MDKVKYKYIFQNDYNPKYINGAYGGINPQGEIVANFYFERTPLPVSQSYQIDDKGRVTDALESEPSDLNQSLIRFIENGVIMNYETAKEIYEWLGLHIQKLEELPNIQKSKNN